jgi:hypothetical protein
MNILQVIEATLAGVGRHVRGLCQGLIAQGQQVTVAYALHRCDEAFKRFVADRQNEVRFIPMDIRALVIGVEPSSRSCSARSTLERVMNSGENVIGMRIPRSAWFLRDLRSPHSYAVSNRVHNTLLGVPSRHRRERPAHRLD